MRLAVQVTLAPGETVGQRLENLAAYGFEAVELPTDAVEALAEYRSALAGVPLEALSMCSRSVHDLVSDGFTQRRRVAEIERILDGCAELGVRVFISVPVRGGLPEGVAADDRRDASVRGLELLAPHAERAGVTIVIEPLNRYETHLLNTLADAVEIARRVDSPAVKIMADFFHMNIEEDDLATSIRRAGDWIAHVHLADSQRCQPGTGHLDFLSSFRALHETGYGGAMALECRLRGDPDEALRECVRFLTDVRENAAG